MVDTADAPLAFEDGEPADSGGESTPLADMMLEFQGSCGGYIYETCAGMIRCSSVGAQSFISSKNW